SRDVVAVVNLVALGGKGRPRVELAGDSPRSPAVSLVETAATRILDQTGSMPTRPSALRQLVDLAFPFSLYEQAPFVARGFPAVTLTTAPDRPPPSFGDTPERLDAGRLAFWLFAGVLFELLGVLGAWPRGAARPPSLESSAAAKIAFGPVIVFLLASALAWFPARERLLPRRPVLAEEELAGYTAAFLA